MTTDDRYAEIAPFYDLEFDSFDADIELYLGYANLVGGPVLELGCGTGRLIEPLARAGFDVVGVDSSAAMISLARQRLCQSGLKHKATLFERDMRDLGDHGTSTFRLILISVNSFLHLESIDDQLRTLEEVRRNLDRDGLLIVDVFNPSPETLAKMDDRYAFDGSWQSPDGQSVERFSYRQLDSAAQTITTNLFYDTIGPDGRVRRQSTEYVMRYVHRFELELLLRHSGFEVEGFYGSYELEAFGAGSEQMIVVAHRTANPGEVDEQASNTDALFAE